MTLRILSLLLLPFFLAGCGIGLVVDPAADQNTSSLTSQISALNAPFADGVSAASIQITLRNIYDYPIVGVTPTFGASGFRNTLTQNCTPSDNSGVSTCANAFVSEVAETKQLKLTFPVEKVGDSVTFTAADRGYNARSCGFDLNRNGVRGEAADCRICDGITLDPDGDGTNEDLIYIDSTSGSDATGDGSSSRPYQTIAKAITVADGPGDGAEEILCLSGTFNETITVTQGGVAGTYTADSFLFPRHPLTIVGWDKDADGVYPPLDPDDTAVLDGQNALKWALIDDVNASYIEMAHLSVRRYRDTGVSDGGMARFLGAGTRQYFSFHDLEVESINDGLVDNDVGDRFAFNISNNSGTFGHISVLNSSFRKIGATFWFVWRSTPDWVGTLIKGNTMELNAAANAADFVFTRALSGFRYEDNYATVNLDASWNVATDRFTAVTVSSCSKDATIRNNTFENFSHGLNVFFHNPECTPSTTTDNVVFDSNRVKIAFQNYDPIIIQSAKTSGSPSNANNTTEDITITNNFILGAAPTIVSCFRSFAGNDAGANPGAITFSGNTCVGTIQNRAAGIFTGANAFPEQDYTFRNNIFASATSPYFIELGMVLSGWIADGNIYSGTGIWKWAGTDRATLAIWKAASASDSIAKQCDPTFVNPASADYHLAASDTCARDSGIDITATVPLDYDGDARSSAAPDVGADEIP